MTVAGMLFLAWLVVVVFWMSNHYVRENQKYEQEYKRGIPVYPLKQTGTSKRHGTRITFRPDTEIFTTTDFSFEKLSERLREKAFLNKGIRITIVDEREDAAGDRAMTPILF